MITRELKKKESCLSGKRVMVVGCGKTGFSTSLFLKRCGAEVIATDISPPSSIEKIEELEKSGITVEAGGHRGKSFFASDLIVVSPGVEIGMPLLKEAEGRGIEVISDIELVFRFLDVPVFAVTGTNGKSTTTALLARVFENAGKRVFMGGNIGVPAAEYFKKEEGYELCVLEISSFHLEAIKTFRPHVAILLNITEDHLYRHKSFSEYAGVKFRIFSNQGPGDYAVLNAGDGAVMDALQKEKLKGRVIPFTTSGELKEGLYLKGEEIVFSFDNKEEVYPASGAHLAGIHNTENIMAVIAAARICGIGKDIITDTVRNFRGLPHRMEFVREREGVIYLNDSKSTNAGSLHKALEGIKGKKSVVLIAGGKDKGGSYDFLKGRIKEKVRLLIVIGEAKKRLKDTFENTVETLTAESLEEAVGIAGKRAAPGDTVLLSPACSSFDMFRNFEERGQVFRRLVEGL